MRGSQALLLRGRPRHVVSYTNRSDVAAAFFGGDVFFVLRAAIEVQCVDVAPKGAWTSLSGAVATNI